MPSVTAVVVTHDGERWIPTLLQALSDSSRLPDRLVAVDTGSTDDSRRLVAEAVGADRVVDVPRTTGYGSAVAAGLGSVPPGATTGATEWVWLLHDDCAPAPDALERLLDVVATDPTVDVVGCRVRAWPRGRRLLEVGVTVTGTGHRETGLELGEYDQGQHDGLRQVLAVSSAGMLVRRELWERLGGFDRRLPLFRDDLDFGWRVARAGGRVIVSPDAILFHAEAATRGARSIASTSASPQRADRRAALHVLLANCALLALPLQYVRLFLGSLLRAVGYLLGKLPGAAWDELVAMLSVLGRPDRIVAARVSRRRTATVGSRTVRPLLPPWYTPYLNGLDSVISLFADRVRDTATTVAASARRLRSGRSTGAELESGPAPDEAVNLPTGPGPVVWARLHPGWCTFAVLTVLAVVATRGLWGGGRLQGGALLPAPDSAGSWWGTFTESWHPVALGSVDAASPYVAWLGAAGTLLLGQASLLVDLVMLLAVPLAGFGAYVFARQVVAGTGPRIWVTVSYALLPVVSGAVTAGRFGTVVAVVLLPWLARCALPVVRGDAPWRAAFATTAMLAVLVSFCPIGWVVAVLAALPLIVGMVVRGRSMAAMQIVLVVVGPALLLMPWSLRFLDEPGLLLTEAGRFDPVATSLQGDSWTMFFGRLGAPGDAPWWLAVGIVLAAVAAWTRQDVRDRVAAGWYVAAVALTVAAVGSVTTITDPGSGIESFGWVGFPVVLAQAAGIVVAAIAADGLRGHVATATFGWRQPAAAVVTALAVASTIAGAAWWTVAGTDGELRRASDQRLPAYLFDTLRQESQQRILVVTGDEQEVDYEVLADDGFRLGDDSVSPELGSARLDDVIADALSSSSPDAVPALVDQGIGYVMLPAPADTDLVAAFDGVPGLTRASTDADQVVGWQTELPAGFVRLLERPEDVAEARILPSASGEVEAEVDEGSADRQVRVAAPADAGFEAGLGDREFAATDGGDGVTIFDIGAGSGTLDIIPGGNRGWWLVGQAIGWLVVIVLATPSLQHRPGLAETTDEEVGR